jgi:hypothetical protein
MLRRSGENRGWPIPSTIHDEAWLVESCETVDGVPTLPDILQVDNPYGDGRLIRVSWLGGAHEAERGFAAGSSIVVHVR